MADGEPPPPSPPQEEVEDNIHFPSFLNPACKSYRDKSHLVFGSFKPVISCNRSRCQLSPSSLCKRSFADVVKEASPLPKALYSTVLKGSNSASKESMSDLVGEQEVSALKPISLFQGKPAVVFKIEDKKQLLSHLNHTLVGKFSHGCPSMLTIKSFFVTLKLQGKYNMSLLDNKHLVIECECKSDFFKLWLKLNWIIQGFRMRVFKWDSDFKPTKESPIAPVWVTFTGIPIYMFEEKALLSISNAIGTPIKIDPVNVNRVDLSSARVCVELDVSKPLMDLIFVCFEDDNSKEVLDGFWVKVKYDVVPPFCIFCSHIGHDMEECKRRSECVLVQDCVVGGGDIKGHSSASTLQAHSIILPGHHLGSTSKDGVSYLKNKIQLVKHDAKNVQVSTAGKNILIRNEHATTEMAKGHKIVLLDHDKNARSEHVQTIWEMTTLGNEGNKDAADSDGVGNKDSYAGQTAASTVSKELDINEEDRRFSNQSGLRFPGIAGDPAEEMLKPVSACVEVFEPVSAVPVQASQKDDSVKGLKQLNGMLAKQFVLAANVESVLSSIDGVVEMEKLGQNHNLGEHIGSTTELKEQIQANCCSLGGAEKDAGVPAADVAGLSRPVEDFITSVQVPKQSAAQLVEHNNQKPAVYPTEIEIGSKEERANVGIMAFSAGASPESGPLMHCEDENCTSKEAGVDSLRTVGRVAHIVDVNASRQIWQQLEVTSLSQVAAEQVEQVEQVMETKIGGKTASAADCNSLGNCSKNTQQWKARRPYVVEMKDHGSNKNKMKSPTTTKGSSSSHTQDISNGFSMLKDRMRRLRGEEPARKTLKVLTARSISPVGRSSEKMSKLRKKIEYLKYKEGMAIVVDKETYNELNENLNEDLRKKVSSFKEKRQASTPKDSTEGRNRNRKN